MQPKTSVCPATFKPESCSWNGENLDKIILMPKIYAFKFLFIKKFEALNSLKISKWLFFKAKIFFSFYSHSWHDFCIYLSVFRFVGKQKIKR